MTRSLCEAEADLFKVLGHPVRIRLLEALAGSSRCTAELRAQVHAPAAGLSQQLSVLRRAGLVAARREGAALCYTLTTPRVVDLLTAGRAMLTQFGPPADPRPPAISGRRARRTPAVGRPKPATR